MKFGISNNVRSRVVRECTPELFHQALASPLVARVCAEIEDALEAVRRGEMSKDDFETLKAARKKMLPVITPHATFRNGRRLNADAIPSGLSMYDVDHIPDRAATTTTTSADVKPSWASSWPTSRPAPRACACCSSSPQGWTWPRPSAGCPRSWATATTTGR